MEMMDFLQTYNVPVIVGICLCVGYLIKKSLRFISNQYIPVILGCLGLVINIVLNVESITAEVILAGLFSGLASTGMHNIFKNLIE